MRILLSVAVAAVLLAQCKTKSQSGSVPADSSVATAPSDTVAARTDSANSDTSVDAGNGIQEKYWKLTELMGKPIPPTPADSKEIHIKFRNDQNRLEAFGGCNGLGGSYELKADDRISISNILRTQIACPQLDTENELIKALESADNYNLNDDKLVLNKARMAPLARFEAVYFK